MRSFCVQTSPALRAFNVTRPERSIMASMGVFRVLAIGLCGYAAGIATFALWPHPGRAFWTSDVAPLSALLPRASPETTAPPRAQATLTLAFNLSAAPSVRARVHTIAGHAMPNAATYGSGCMFARQPLNAPCTEGPVPHPDHARHGRDEAPGEAADTQPAPLSRRRGWLRRRG
jgi:hypothetical protein